MDYTCNILIALQILQRKHKVSLEGKQGQPQKPYILLFDFSIVLAA